MYHWKSLYIEVQVKQQKNVLLDASKHCLFYSNLNKVLTFVTNFCSWFIVTTKVVIIIVFFGFTLWFKLVFSRASVYNFPSYFVEHDYSRVL